MTREKNLELIEKNKAAFLNMVKDFNFFNDEFVAFLGDDIFIAPASAKKSDYNAFPGGLLDFIFKVAKYAVKVNDLLPDEKKANKEALIKCAFLSQLGKVKLFTPCESEWHRVNQGKMYEYDETLIAMSICERALQYCSRFKIELSEKEFQAISLCDRAGNSGFSYYSEPISQVLQIATKLAIIECK